MRVPVRQIGLFGELSSFDPALVPKGYAGRTRNVRVVEGVAVPRYGWGSLEAAQSNFRASYGMKFCRVLSDAGVETEEFLCFEDVDAAPPSTTVRLFGRNPLTGAATVYTSGVSNLDLHASLWGLLPYGSEVFGFNRSDSSYPLFRVTPGDYDSVTAVKPPSAPADALTVAYVKNVVSGSEQSYRVLTFTGLDTTNDITCSGAASGGETKSITAGGAFRVQLGANKTGALSTVFEFDGGTGPGAQDFTYPDVFKLGIAVVNGANVPLRFDPASIKVYWINNSGSPVTFPLEVLWVSVEEWAVQLLVRFSPAASRALRGNIVDLQVDIEITEASSTSANNVLEVGPLTIGGINPEVLPGTGVDNDASGRISAWSRYRNSTTGNVSALSPALELTQASWRGASAGVFDGKGRWFGTVPKVTVVGSAESGVDQWELWTRYYDASIAEKEEMRLHGAFTDSGGTLVQPVYQSIAEWLALPKFSADTSPNLRSEDIVAAFAMQESVHWGMVDGTIEVSYPGNPLRLFSDTDNVTPEVAQGQRFYMSPSRDDVMRSGAGIEQTAGYFGGQGVYVTTGKYPAAMGSPHKLAKLLGVVGRNGMCVWQDDEGAPGWAYADTEMNVWFVRLVNPQDLKHGFQPVEVSIDERARIKEWLFAGAANPDYDRVTVGVDSRSDALVVKYRNREAWFRRKHLLTDRRPWEFYDRELGSAYSVDVDVSDAYGVSALRSTGEFDEFEYDRNNGFAAREGLLRDNGSAMPPCEWETGLMVDVRRTLLRVAPEMVDEGECLRDFPGSDGPLPTVKVVVTVDGRELLPISKLARRRFVEIGQRAVGDRFLVAFVIPEGSAGIRGYELEFAAVAGRF